MIKMFIHRLTVASIYLGFFGLIAFAVYITKSAWPLLALICMPSIKSEYNDEEINKKNSDEKQ